MANEFDWLKYGKDYGEVNKNLNGLPGFFQEIGRRWKENKGGPIERLLGVGEDPALMASQKYFVNPVSAGITGAANMALGGLPSAVAGKIAPQYAARQAATRAENPIATGIGQGAGLAGAVLAPTAAAGAGMQLGPAGAKLGTTALRNLLLSSAYAVPAAGAEAMETGNIPRAALHGGLNTLAGGVIGTLGEKLTPLLSRLVPGAKARSMGIGPRDVKSSLIGGGKAAGVGPKGQKTFMARKGEALMQNIGKLYDKFGGGRKGLEQVDDFVQEGYGQLGRLYDKSGTKLANQLGQIDKSPDIAALRNQFGAQAVDDEILNTVGRVDKMGFTEAYADHLTRLATEGRRAGTLSKEALQGGVAEAIKSHMGSLAETLRAQYGKAGLPSLQELNELYGATRASVSALAGKAAEVPGLVTGSTTAPRSALIERLIGSAAGGAVGGAGGKKKEEGWPSYLTRVGVGTMAGGVLGKQLSKAGNRLGGPVASLVQGALPFVTAAGRAAGGMGAGLPAASEALGLQGVERASPLVKAMTGEPETAPEAAPAEAAEAQAGPQGTEEAKQETNAAFRDRVIGELQKAWGGLQAAGTKMTFDEFTALVGQYTNDFDPKMAAPILFPDPQERERYLKTYENALAMKKMDLESVFRDGRWSERAQNQLAKQSLENYMVGLLGGQEKMADPKLQELVARDVEAIRRLPGDRFTAADKQAALRRLLQSNYGIDFDLLSQYGIA